MYKIIYRKSASKDLAKLPKKLALQFESSFEKIAIGDCTHLDIKKLEGLDYFRLRIGSYRAIYQFINDVMVIQVLKIGSRGDIYK